MKASFMGYNIFNLTEPMLIDTGTSLIGATFYSQAEVVANYYLYCSIAEQRDDVWNPASAKLSHHQVTSCFKSYKVGQVQKEKCVARLE